MTRPTPALLRPPHGYADLTFPEPSPLRAFLEICAEQRDFICAASEREQVHLVHRWSQDSECGPLSLRQLAEFFEVGKSTIQHHLSKPYEQGTADSPCKNGRPSLLDEEQAFALNRFIQEKYDLRMPVTYQQCTKFLHDQFRLSVNVASLRAFLQREGTFKTVIGTPMEDSRNFCSEEEINEYLSNLEHVLSIAKIPSAFVVNIDEAGFAEFVDAQRSTRIVPTNYPLKSIPVPVTRSEKRATLLAGLCADGSALKPLVIVQRDTLEQEFLLRGYTDDKILYAKSDKGYMTKKLFLRWGRLCLIPEMRLKRTIHGYDGPIVLLLDRFGCHCSDEFVSMCEEENIQCMFLPPHTSDQLQPCDLGLFAVQKRWMNSIQIQGDLNKQTRQIVKIIDSYRMATTFKNVTGAFRKAGIVSYVDENLRLIARFDIRFATAVRHLNIPEDDDDRLPDDKVRINIF